MLRRVGLGAVIVVMAGTFMFMGLQRVSAAASCFTDVDDAAWYEPYVCAMATINVLTGYPDGTFNPEGNITRAEVAVVADRLVNNQVVNAGQLNGLNNRAFQRSYFAEDVVPTYAIPGPGTYTVAEATITTADFFCLIGSIEDSDLLVHVSGFAQGDVSDTATMHLLLNGTAVDNTWIQADVNGAHGTPLALTKHLNAGGGAQTVTLQVSEGSDVYNLSNVNLTVELLQDTQCERFIFPLENELESPYQGGDPSS